MNIEVLGSVHAIFYGDISTMIWGFHGENDQPLDLSFFSAGHQKCFPEHVVNSSKLLSLRFANGLPKVRLCLFSKGFTTHKISKQLVVDLVDQDGLSMVMQWFQNW